MKNKFFTFLILSLLPATLFLSVSYLKQFQGPYYYGTNADPDYVYLLNSLNVARLKLPGHIDHPGTPVQVIGAITISFTHLISGKGKIVDDVLARPEDYIQVINTVFIWLNVIALFISGWLVYRTSQKIATAILFQFAPFLTGIPEYLLKVSTEPILIISCLLFSTLVYQVFAKEDLEEKKHTYLILFALLSGFGMATKITFFPLLLIPMVLFKRWLDKLYFFVAFILSFCVLAFPIIFRWGYFRDWIKGLFYGSGMYGSGSQTIVDPLAFFQNLVEIISTEIVVDVIFLSALILLIVSFFYNRLKNYRQLHLIRFQVISMSVIIFAVYLVIVAKHFQYHYMIPPIIFSIVPLIGCLHIVGSLLNNTVYKSLAYGSSFFLLFIFVSINQKNAIKKIQQALQYHNLKQSELISLIDRQYHSGFKIYSYGSSSKQQSFSLAVGYTHDERATYITVLKQTYKNCVFFSPWDKRFYDWSPSLPIKIKDVLNGQSEVYLNCIDLIQNGVTSNNKLPILDMGSGEPTGEYLYLKNLNKASEYRETIYKLDSISK
jgi:hypothetical protein